MKRFERFVLDTVNQCLRRGQEVLSLTPKAFGVLRYLVDHAGRLVTKGELLEAIWPQTFVQEAVLKVCVLEIRKALGEDPKNPRYIQTLHRRGYRFIAPVAESPALGAVTSAVLSSRLFGRSTALDHLHRVLGRASDGERQIVFVSGEPGIGKTMLVETFLEEVAGAGDIWIAAGRCVEHYGAREPYYPVLDALGRLSRQDSNPHLVQVLSKHAPTWLAQMPWLVAPDQQVSLQRDVLGATRERMLREMSEAIEILTSDQSLILALEDLHWSDVSTLDLISWLAHRRDPARLLVLGTYRPVEVIIHQHPLKSLRRELQSRGFASELALELLSDADIAAYLAARFPQNDFPHELAATIHRQTDGNPLFMVNVVDYLLARSHIADAHGHWQFQVPLANFSLEVPENLRQMIEKQIDRLSPQEQETLEIASAAGVEFSALVVSAVSGQGLPEIEDSCDRLSQRGQFLRSKGLAEFPDGSVSARYEFVHSLYRTVFYGRIPSSRRIRCHQRIGERLEASYGGRAREVATELAMHFQEGFDFARTIHYLALAAEKSASRYAHSETIELLRQALEHCERLQEPKRIDLELRLLEQTGQAYRLRGDFARAAEEFEKMAERAAGLRPDRTAYAGASLACERTLLDQSRGLSARSRNSSGTEHAVRKPIVAGERERPGRLLESPIPTMAGRRLPGIGASSRGGASLRRSRARSLARRASLLFSVSVFSVSQRGSHVGREPAHGHGGGQRNRLLHQPFFSGLVASLSRRMGADAEGTARRQRDGRTEWSRILAEPISP